MRAFFTDLNDWGPWGFAGREYLRCVRKLGPFVVRGPTAWVAGPVKTPGIKVLDAATGRMLRQQAKWLNPPTTTFYHGWLGELARYQEIYTPPGGASIAIVNWPGNELPDVEPLRRFTSVWVSTLAQAVLLRDAGLDAVYVPVPLDEDLDIARALPTTLRMSVAAGTWRGPDNLEGVTAAFLGAFGRADNRGLHLVCRGLSLDAEQLCQLDPAERPFEELPPVSVDPKEPESTEAWLNLLAYCDTYLSLRDDNAGDYFALLAGQAGCRVVGRNAVVQSFSRGAEESDIGIVAPGQDPGATLRWAATELHPVDPGELYGATPTFETALAQATRLAMEKRSDLGQQLGVVVTHHDQGHERLAATLLHLCQQLLTDEILVISDHSSDPDASKGALELATRYGAELVSVPVPPDGIWSMARCRNAGARAAIAAGAELLLFVDCDVLLPQVAVWHLLEQIGGPRQQTGGSAPGPAPNLGPARRIDPRQDKDILVSDPRLVNALRAQPVAPQTTVMRDFAAVTVCPGQELLEEPNLGGDWPGDAGEHRTVVNPGNLLVRVAAFVRLHGFDEAYAGRGLEDEDFKLRARQLPDASWIDLLDVVAYRQPGTAPVEFPNVSSQRAAEARFARRKSGGDPGEINPRGWGSEGG